MSERDRSEGSLERSQDVRAVLGYWLEALRYEEALAGRPRARRPPRRPPEVNLVEPGSGQAYFRIPLELAEFALGSKGALRVPIDDGILRFLEHWLRQAYRREAAEANGGEREVRGMRWLFGWPTLHFERREELATLIRVPIELGWLIAGDAWKPPTYFERRARKATGLPDQIQLAEESGRNAEETLPLSVDFGLLNRTLGVLPEAIAETQRRWEQRRPTARQQLLDVLGLFGEKDTGKLAVPELLTLLGRTVRSRTPAGVAAYPAALVQDASLHFATYHLQNELAGLLSAEDDDPVLSPGGGLWQYLRGAPAQPGWDELRSRYRPRGLTASQRIAGEQFLGSRLTAVQGPPGTGKTELILNLAAERVVARATALAAGEPMPTDLLVVASTNNRAVDNVLDPLARDPDPGDGSSRANPDCLPLGLRAGSQEVTAAAAGATLERARRWLEGRPTEGAAQALAAALDHFRACSEVQRSLAAPLIEPKRREQKRRELDAELAALPPGEAQPPDPVVLRALEAARERIGRLLDRAQVGRRKAKRLSKAWGRFEAEILPDLTAAAPELAAHLRATLPPSGGDPSEEAALSGWEDGLAEVEAAVDAALEPFSPAAWRAAERRAVLTRARAVLDEGDGEPGTERIEPPHEDLDRAGFLLFESALEVRRAWAVAHRDELLVHLAKARDLAADLRSLRRMSGQARTTWIAVRRLFPVLGCTLLSLGNVFDAEAETIDQLVIDEAGQCHPAYAISGLLRASRALLIGDVHQLPPVVQLSTGDEARVARSSGVTAARFTPYRVHEDSQVSAQSLADRAMHTRPTMIDHFRCQREIIALSDQLCGYGLVVHTPRRALPSGPLTQPLMFQAVDGAQTPIRGSWANLAEADALIAVLRELGAAGLEWSQVAVLTPYVGQLDLLRQRLREAHLPLESGADDLGALFPGEVGGVATGTVHRFQGGERAVVLLSTVVTEARSLPFLDTRVNLLNVAISRARDRLAIFGHAPTLLAGVHTRLLVPRDQAEEATTPPVRRFATDHPAA